MRKTLLFLTAVSFLFFGCGEAGVEADISKDNEIEISVSNLTATDPSFSESVNLAEEEFNEYLDDIENFFVNKIDVQITDVSGDVFNIDGIPRGIFQISVNNNLLFEVADLIHPEFGLFVDANNNLKTTERISVYNSDNSVSTQIQANEQAVNSLIASLENRSQTTASAIFVGRFVNANITIKVFVDLTARTQID